MIHLVFIVMGILNAYIGIILSTSRFTGLIEMKILEYSRQLERKPSAVSWLKKLDAGELSSEELFQQTVEQVKSANESVHAVISDNYEQGLVEARLADERRSKGESAPLLGLPVTIKDSIEVAGLLCTAGTFAREEYIPEQDATAVARLRKAGAIVVAKTNVPEYSSSYETDNAVFGRTNNPFDLSRTSGGSSGGEGALLGADASIVGVGADGGGSIRLPSHYCGTCGIRPTVGLVPETGASPSTRDTGYRDLMCIGPMARYVEDLALLLPIMAGPDWVDPYAVTRWPADAPVKEVSDMTIGYFDYDGVTRVSPGTLAAVKDAVELVSEAGAKVEEVTLPSPEEATEIFFSLAGADGGIRTLRDLEGANGRHHSQFQSLLDGFGNSMSLSDFFDIQHRSFSFRSRMRQLMSQYDAIIGPVTTGPAPKHMQVPFGIDQQDYLSYLGFNYLHIFALAGVPVTVVPMGMEDAMPIGVQVAAQAYCEKQSLALAQFLQDQQ